MSRTLTLSIMDLVAIWIILSLFAFTIDEKQ